MKQSVRSHRKFLCERTLMPKEGFAECEELCERAQRGVRSHFAKFEGFSFNGTVSFRVKETQLDVVQAKAPKAVYDR